MIFGLVTWCCTKIYSLTEDDLERVTFLLFPFCCESFLHSSIDIKCQSFQFSGRRTPTPTATWLSMWVWTLRWPSTIITMKSWTPSLTHWSRSLRGWEKSKVTNESEKYELHATEIFLFDTSWILIWNIVFWDTISGIEFRLSAVSHCFQLWQPVISTCSVKWPDK